MGICVTRGAVVNRPLVVAHRGVSHGTGENTIASFDKAIEVGADMIEFDVRRTSDGELIAFHDRQIKGIAIAELTLDQITAAAGRRPPLLAEILDHSAGRIKLDIDFKEDGYVPQVVDLAEKYFPGDELLLTSLLPRVLVQVKAL